MLHELWALFPESGSGMYTRLQWCEPMLVHPACAPPAPGIARALGLERAGVTSRGRLGAQVAPTLDGVDTTAVAVAASDVNSSLLTSPSVGWAEVIGRAISGGMPSCRHGLPSCPWS
jgi:hypothetical protein